MGERVGSTSDALKEVHGVVDLSAANSNGKKVLPNFQQVNMMNVPYPSSVKEPGSVDAPSSQILGLINAIPPATRECSRTQPLHTTIPGRGPPNSVAVHASLK